jgi:hypothetical protein
VGAWVFKGVNLQFDPILYHNCHNFEQEGSCLNSVAVGVSFHLDGDAVGKVFAEICLVTLIKKVNLMRIPIFNPLHNLLRKLFSVKLPFIFSLFIIFIFVN